MFAACPHCQFLVARHPLTRALPPACPRCGKPLEDAVPAAPAPPPSLASYLHATPAAEDAAPAAAADAPQDLPAAESGAGEATAATADATPDDTPTAASGPASDDMAPASVDAESIGSIAGARDDARDDGVDADRDGAAATGAASGDASSVEALPAEIPRTVATPSPARAKPATSPRFVRSARTTPVHARTARWQWTAVAVLALLLFVQVLVADRARLSMQAGWRPLVSALCDALGCDVPTWREPQAFAMLSRDVRPVPGAPGTLHAQATFRNDARWAQAWPVIVLTLKDADGRTLGARALQPQDYLGGAAPTAAIGPGQSAQVAVRVHEPSANVVAFSFDFR